MSFNLKNNGMLFIASYLTQVGEYFGVSYATVSRAVKKVEGRGENVNCKA
jgi:DNA-binding MarR family transcriptional regulator